MRVHIELLRHVPALSARLESDGWRLESPSEHSLVVHHPEVASPEQARERLYRLDMLTSGALRIAFFPPQRIA